MQESKLSNGGPGAGTEYIFSYLLPYLYDAATQH
jgi:hypothetical protein